MGKRLFKNKFKAKKIVSRKNLEVQQLFNDKGKPAILLIGHQNSTVKRLKFNGNLSVKDIGVGFDKSKEEDWEWQILVNPKNLKDYQPIEEYKDQIIMQTMQSSGICLPDSTNVMQLEPNQNFEINSRIISGIEPLIDIENKKKKN
ncbi:MAG: hypothetical protein HZA77_11680 [Candidatus Schekmanbacteria bacterium]|nr:hypothetical protein [Candidatus Schekmanbacteria bacterium]